MKISEKKLKSGFSIPVFGLGTWAMGGRDKTSFKNDEKDLLAIKNALDAGITHIDTAELYGNGHAEELIGEVLKNYDRNKIFLVSKVWKTNLAYDDVLKACERSLKRLSTDYLDLYLIHMPSPIIPIKETMKAFNKLKREKLIRNIGVSDFTVERTKEAQNYSDYKIVANHLHYNLIYREAEKKGLVDFCKKEDIMLIAWRPVQQGILTKKGTGLLDLMCNKYGKTPAQIAINWLISQKNIVTLSKMSEPTHLQENLEALNFKMSGEDIEKLRSDFPNQQDLSNAVPLI